ncbi:MAG: lipoate--protein ligase family protein [Acidobacteria bacterium]|jgi:lipoate-protein ligase A|nr:lipoate--protein ligase family protein [Acidobacteriota bacterium]
MPAWFLLFEPEPLPAAENMARDEHLFNLCHERKCGFLRLYSWIQPTFSIGASQPAQRALNLEFIRRSGCAYVRRVTGGKAVLHDREVTYAVASSEDLFFREHDLHQSYMLISRVLLQAIRSLGVAATLSRGSAAELSRSHNPCFSFPTPHEIEVAGKKIVGSAQKRDREALLQHGSIPLAMDYDLYAGGAGFPAEALRGSMTTWGDLTSRDARELKDSLVLSFREFIGCDLVPVEFTAADRERIAALREKYAADAWNLSK